MADIEKRVRDHAKQLSLRRCGDGALIDQIADAALDAWYYYTAMDSAQRADTALVPLDENGSAAKTYSALALDDVIKHGERLIAAMRKLPDVYGPCGDTMHGAPAEFQTVRAIIARAQAVRGRGKDEGQPRKLKEHALVRQLAHLYSTLNGSVPSYGNKQFIAWLDDWCRVFDIDAPSEHIRKQAVQALKQHGPLG